MAKEIKRLKISYERKKALAGWLFIIPWSIGIIYFLVIPVITSIIYSFAKVTIETTGNSVELIGFKNYLTIFQEDPEFLRKLVSSLQNMLLQVPVVVLFSLFVAMLLNQKFIGRIVFRTMFFLPVIIASGIIITVITKDAFSQNVMQSSGSSQLMKSQFLNTFLLENGVSQQIVSIITTLINNIFHMIWKSGIQILIFLAGLQTISPSMYEAAQMEGSTGWETFWYVTFPMLSPMILLNFIYSVIDNFTDYANDVMVYINQFTTKLDIELGSAMAWTYFALVLLIIAVVYFFINKKVFYQV